MVRFRCAVDASIQGLHTPVDNELGQAFSTLPSGLVAVRSQPSPLVCLSCVGTGQPPSLSGTLRLPLSDLRDWRMLSICPSMPRHRHSMSCTSLNSNGNRSSKGLVVQLQSSGLHASCLPAQPTSTRNVAPSEARTDGSNSAVIQRASLVRQIKRIPLVLVASRPRGST